MHRPTLILLVGIPGSGKSTYAENYISEYPKTPVHLSSDKIREELYGNESIQGNPAEVFSLMQKRAVEALNEGHDVLYDATNVTRKDRASIIGICPKFTKIEAHIIWAPIEECIKRDSSRDRTVGKEVIDRMLKRFQAPYYDEGIDEIKIVRPDNFDVDAYLKKVYVDMEIPHDNPHHTSSVDTHCFISGVYAAQHSNDIDLIKASNYHDIGKPYVKAFVDSKGNPCDTAHYYQHQAVGAWISYGLLHITPYSAWLISTHMEPFFGSKYYKNLPQWLKQKIDLLHEADLNAH